MSLDAFDHAVHTANTWLADLAREIGDHDRRYAYRVLRAWLHTLRDRLPVNDAVKFSAQLPELLRGVYFDGWEPARTPVKYGPDEYIARFALESRIPATDVAEVAPVVTRALGRRISAGQLEEALDHLPAPVREVVAGPDATARAAARPAPAGQGAARQAATAGRAGGASAGRGPGWPASRAAEGSPEELLAELQARVDNLTEAVRVMAEGLEDNPLESAPTRNPARGARLAAEILMAGKTGRQAA